MEENKERALETLKSLEPDRINFLKYFKKRSMLHVTLPIIIITLITTSVLLYFSNGNFAQVKGTIGIICVINLTVLLCYYLYPYRYNYNLRYTLKEETLPIFKEDFNYKTNSFTQKAEIEIPIETDTNFDKELNITLNRKNHLKYIVSFIVILLLLGLTSYFLTKYFEAPKIIIRGIGFIGFILLVFVERQMRKKGFKINKTSDRYEAENTITPDFIKRIDKFGDLYEIDNITLSFSENIMTIKFEIEDIYEPFNIYTPLTDPKVLGNFYSKIDKIYNSIDYIKK